MVARQPNVELYTDDDDQEPDNGIVYIYNMFTYMTITYYLLLGLPQFADAPPTPSLAIVCIEAPPAPVVAPAFVAAPAAPAPVAAPATPTSLPAPAAPVPAVAPALTPVAAVATAGPSPAASPTNRHRAKRLKL